MEPGSRAELVAVDGHEVPIALTNAQIRQVTRAATDRSGGLAALLAQQADLQAAAQAIQASAEISGISRSALRAVLVLCAFPRDGSYRALGEVAPLVGLSPSTAHRYVTTWAVVGVL
jgi:hypothetical protein